ncbi:hypothetical protein ACGF3G_29570 [Streptomyces sp. NPDC048179]|uniref:hypothetical protein n=1 Tax=Streptomyces sp. NPDC048179 TaxID=3365506 RepID=UPI003714DE25
MPERIWHPISKLEFFLDRTRRWAVDAKENAETLEEARTKPHVLADADVARIKRVYTEQTGDLTLFEEQAEAWGELPDLSPSRRAKLTTLDEQLAELRTLNKKVLDLADELAKGTIDTVMAISDDELGLAGAVRPEAGRVDPHRSRLARTVRTRSVSSRMTAGTAASARSWPWSSLHG